MPGRRQTLRLRSTLRAAPTLRDGAALTGETRKTPTFAGKLPPGSPIIQVDIRCHAPSAIARAFHHPGRGRCREPSARCASATRSGLAWHLARLTHTYGAPRTRAAAGWPSG